MGATEILQALGKGDELTVSEISEITQISTDSIKKGVRRLLKDVSESLQHRPLTLEEREERYGKTVNAKIYLYWIDLNE